ncbi:MAG: Ni/Fe hydrogenase subunit alpha [Colwellia sp.]|nr:Ni/Fe hydrogenase subunit alpha [Colwellia sp.]
MSYQSLETANTDKPLRRIAIEPVSRVEGHGKVTLLVDENNNVEQARLHIVEFRGFEKFIQGRPYWEVPTMVQRLCGICPVSHLLAASKAMDQVLGITITPTAEKLRRLLHLGQVMQSHALHFFHLSSPDLLFGFESEVAKRNIIGVAEKYPDIGLMGIGLRKYGQQVIEHICGKRVHGTGSVPGGMNKALSEQSRQALLAPIDQMITWSQKAVNLSRDLYITDPDRHEKFGLIESQFMSLNGTGGAFDLYHGDLRVTDAQGNIVLDGVDYRNYHKLIHEQVKSWSYMKFPYLVDQGTEQGWYRVGPLARINNCNFISTPLAEAARVEFKTFHGNKPAQGTLAFHWARMIEMLHCVEQMKNLLLSPDILSTDLMATGQRTGEGVGVIEAPRGTLIHHYQVDDNDLVTMANLIVSTTHNNQAMNESVRQVAQQYLSGNELTEGLLNHIEVAIRAYDPCLSCATHALGKMPLRIELCRSDGKLVDVLHKNGDGKISRIAP